MKSAIRFKHTSVARQQGELARLKVVQGPDYGAVYVVVGKRALIGRGEDSDIMISDLKASRIHAEMQLTNTGWVVRDKASSNGILHNGKAARESRLQIGDTFTLGETTLEFVTSDVGTTMLVAPPRTAEQIQTEQKSFSSRLEKLRGMGIGSTGGASNAKGGLLKNKAVLAFLVGGVLFVLFTEDPAPKKASNKKGADARDLASFLPNAEINRAAETLFKDGFREYLAGNYNRARVQFETVLQIVPGHALASLYIENCDNAIKGEVRFHLDQGKKAHEAGKLRSARSHYERVKRLLYKDQSNPNYIEAKDQLEKVEKEISSTGGSL